MGKANRTGAAGEAGVVEVSVTVAAEAATVYRFLSDPARFSRWMGEGAAVDLRPGGDLRIAYPQGHAARGKVIELVPDRRLVFSYGYETGHAGGGAAGSEDEVAIPAGSTRVEITLTPSDEGTVVTLRHTGLPVEAARRGHVGGWRYYLSVLGGAATAEQHVPGLERLVADYVSAWNEADAGKRRALLERVWEPGGRFANPYGLTRGIDELDTHIANAQRYMPGMTLVSAGAAQEVHGWVRMPWKVVRGGGGSVASGVNILRLAPGGKVREVVGFWDPGPG